MKPVSRRILLKVGAGLVAFVPAARLLAAGPNEHTPAPASPAEGPKPIVNHVGGTVEKIAPNLLAVKAYNGTFTLRLSGTSEVWKGKYDRNAIIDVGDRVEAWGQPQPGNNLDVERMWVNIVNLVGPISNVADNASTVALTCRDRHRGSLKVTIDQETLISNGTQEVRYTQGALSLQEGKQLQIIGLKLKDGSVRATRVFPDHVSA